MNSPRRLQDGEIAARHEDARRVVLDAAGQVWRHLGRQGKAAQFGYYIRLVRALDGLQTVKFPVLDGPLELWSSSFLSTRPTSPRMKLN
jgi:hypothetical protein